MQLDGNVDVAGNVGGVAAPQLLLCSARQFRIGEGVRRRYDRTSDALLTNVLTANC